MGQDVIAVFMAYYLRRTFALTEKNRWRRSPYS
jgi:hypothetical protein